jgi:hypothetical protein
MGRFFSQSRKSRRLLHSTIGANGALVIQRSNRRARDVFEAEATGRAVTTSKGELSLLICPTIHGNRMGPTQMEAINNTNPRDCCHDSGTESMSRPTSTRGRLGEKVPTVQATKVLFRSSTDPAAHSALAQSGRGQNVSLARGMGPRLARTMEPGDGHRRPADQMPQIGRLVEPGGPRQVPPPLANGEALTIPGERNAGRRSRWMGSIHR